MRLVAVGLAVALLAPAVPSQATVTQAAVTFDPAGYVDPLIGSARDGTTWPGAVRPFGMISWSPTSTRGDQTSTGAANGYQYDVTRVRGFSLTHLSGAGCNPGAAGDIPIMPYAGTVDSSPTADTTDAKYATNFRHENERALPGRYTVTLDSGVKTDLAVTTRAGVGEFTFPADQAANLLFRTSNSLNGSEDAEITIDPAHRKVTGSVLTGAFCGRRANGGVNNRKTYYRLYFTASFDQPIVANGTWKDSTLAAGSTHTTGGEGYATGADRAGRGSGGYVTFAPGSEVRMRLGISYVSLAGAEQNLRAETQAERHHRQGRRRRVRRLATRTERDPHHRRDRHATDHVLHSALPHAPAAEHLQRRRRPLPRIRPEDPPARARAESAVRNVLRLGSIPGPHPVARAAQARRRG